MSERNGTANLLSQVTAFRELKEDYSTEVAEALTAKNLLRNGVDASVAEVKGWDKINNAALQGRLDIPTEVASAEGKAAVAAGTVADQAAHPIAAPNVQASSQEEGDDEQCDEQDDESDEGSQADDAPDDDDEIPTLDDMYGYENSEDNEEAALDDILKIQENS